MDFRKKNNFGFTLVEALVVTGVIGIISSIMIVNWRRNEEQYKLQRAAQELVQNIRKAQDYALTGKQIYWTPESRWLVPESYGLYFRRDEQSYFIYGDYIGNDGYQSPEDLSETVTQMETGIEISSFGGGQSLSIFFSVPDGATGFFSSGGTSRTITIRRVGATCPSRDCRNIIIQMTGEVSIQ